MTSGSVRYGIVAVCRVVSEVYEDNKDIWGKDRYPLRVRIEFVPNMQRDESARDLCCQIHGNTHVHKLAAEVRCTNPMY